MNHKKKYVALLSLILYSFCMIYFIFSLSTITGFFVEDTSLHTYRLATILLDTGDFFDELSLGGVNIPFSIWLIVISSLLFIDPLIYAIIIGILTIVLLYLVLENQKVPFTQILLSLFLFLSTALFFIEVFRLSLSPILLFFVLLYVYALQKSYKTLQLSVISLLSFIDVFGFLILLFLFIVEKRLLHIATTKLFTLYKIVIACIIAILSISIHFFTQSSMYFSSIQVVFSINHLIIEFGSQRGFSILLLLLTFIAFFFLWEKSITMLHIVTFCLLLLSFFFQPAILFATVLLSVVGSFVLKIFFESSWRVEIFRYASLFIFILLVLSSQLFYLQTFQQEYPNHIDLLYAREISHLEPSGIVFSSRENGHILEYARLQTFWNSDTTFITNTYRAQTAQFLFQNSELETTYTTLLQQDIRYIYIDPVLQNRLYASYGNSGLLLLLTNQRVFTQIYSQDGYRLYTVNRGVTFT